MLVDLYEGYADALVRLARSIARSAGRTGGEAFDEVVENAVIDFEPELYALAGSTWTARAELESFMGETYRSAFAAVDTMIATSHALGTVLQSGRVRNLGQPPESVRYVTSMLLTRSIRVSHEILAMLRAGFPLGAQARWRTLYELAVVARVLEQGNRWTASRYASHGIVLIARDPSKYLPAADAEAIQRELLPRSRQLVRRYGEPYSGTYGWAAELTKRRLGVRKPQFWHLETLARLGDHDSHLPSANHAVHADSIGGFQTINQAGDFHSGAQTEGLPGGCLATVRTLGQIDGALLGMWINHRPTTQAITLRGLFEELSLVLQRDCWTNT